MLRAVAPRRVRHRPRVGRRPETFGIFGQKALALRKQAFGNAIAHRLVKRLVRRGRVTAARRHGNRWIAAGAFEMAGQVTGCAHPQAQLATVDIGGANPGGRSEEHTSELQSLMRISYAVFCLKKTKNTKIT